MNDLTKQILLWVALAVILLAIFSQFGMRTGQPATIDYSQFLTDIKANSIDSVTLKGEIIDAVYASLLLNEPRITVQEVGVEFTDRRKGLIEVSISYVYNQVNTRHNYVFPYSLNEGTNL